MVRIRFGALAAFVFLSIPTMHGYITPLRSVDRFNRTIINEPFVVAYIYADANCCDKAYRKERKEQIAKNNRVLKAVSRDNRYQATGIQFVTANLSRDHVADLQQQYALSDEDSLLLFEKEEVAPTQLTGSFTRRAVETAIETSWGTKLTEIIKQQEQERKQRLAELKASYAYWGVGPYGGYWPCGYGAGCGWGGWGGYGSGYGCGRNGYLSISGGFCC